MTIRTWMLSALLASPALALPQAARADASLHVAGAAGASQTVRDLEVLSFAPELRAGVGFSAVRFDLALAWLDRLGDVDEMAPVFGGHLSLDSPMGTYSIGLERGLSDGDTYPLLGYLAAGLRTGPIDPVDIALGFDVWARLGRSPENEPALLIGLNISAEWQFVRW